DPVATINRRALPLLAQANLNISLDKLRHVLRRAGEYVYSHPWNNG
ncbi:unnamed protein product, partial [marine sediment metagenome]